MSVAGPGILVMVALPEGEMARLARLGPLHRWDLAPDPGALVTEAGPGVGVVVTDGHAGLSADLVARLPRLSLVASGSAGVEGIDRAALRARGVPLANVAPALADDVADLAVLLMLAAWRGLLAGDALVRSGGWARRAGPGAPGNALPLGRALRGRRLGLLGLGHIGRAVAGRAGAFGLEVAYHARTPRPGPWRHEPDLGRLAGWSDVLVVAVPGGAATRGLVSEAVIGALGPGGVLVNVARGSVVDEGALIAALASGRLGAAGLDVFASEPEVDPRLRALPNVVLSPHAGSATQETRAAMARMVVDSVEAHLGGRPLPSPVA